MRCNDSTTLVRPNVGTDPPNVHSAKLASKAWFFGRP